MVILEIILTKGLKEDQPVQCNLEGLSIPTVLEASLSLQGFPCFPTALCSIPKTLYGGHGKTRPFQGLVVRR